MNDSEKKSSLYLPDASWAAAESFEGVSDTILERVGHGKLIKADLLLGRGWLRMLGRECDEDEREQWIEQWSREKTKKASRPTKFIIPGSIPRAEPKPPEWLDDHDGILSRLESEEVCSDEFEKAVLIAEITDFAEDKIERLLNALGQFISNHRFATGEDAIILLGCAIRKYALNMSPEQLEEYADWLAMGEAKAIHNRVELELVKGILWRVSYEPFVDEGVFPKTVDTLQEISHGYLNPRLIFQESNVSIATLAVSALFVLRVIASDEESIGPLLNQVKDLNRDWISELVEDDILEAIDAMSERDPVLSEKMTTCFERVKAELH